MGYRAWKAGDLACAQSLQENVRQYVDLVWMFHAMADVCKVVLSSRLGIDCGRAIPPVNSLTGEEKREALRVAESLGVTKRLALKATEGRVSVG